VKKKKKSKEKEESCVTIAFFQRRKQYTFFFGEDILFLISCDPTMCLSHSFEGFPSFIFCVFFVGTQIQSCPTRNHGCSHLNQNRFDVVHCKEEKKKKKESFSDSLSSSSTMREKQKKKPAVHPVIVSSSIQILPPIVTYNVSERERKIWAFFWGTCPLRN
jgi:hypothetical protein